MGREYPAQPVVGVGAVVLRPSADATGSLEVLLIKRANPPSRGEWSLPGGVVELGERLEAAIVREVREETGLTVEPLAVAEVLDHIVSDSPDPTAIHRDAALAIRYHYVLIDFLCRVVDGVLVSSSDASDAARHSVDGLSLQGEYALSERTIGVISSAAAKFSQQVT